jgi:hypothetical protein
MEQRNVFLQGIATALNALGSALVSVYDLTASTLGSVLSGEKEKPDGKIREYEQKIERLYSEVGKEVSKDREILSAAGEAALGLIAEYRLEIEKIKQGIQPIAKTESPEKERAPQGKEPAPMEKRPEPETPVIATPVAEPEGVIEKESQPEEITAEPYPEETIVSGGTLSGVEVGTGEEVVTERSELPIEVFSGDYQASKAPVAFEEISNVEIETEQEIVAENAGKPIEVIPDDYRVSEAPVTEDTSPVVETETEEEVLTETQEKQPEQVPAYSREILGNKLKGDLLALCTEKGIEADKSMTKAEIIELLMRQS